MEQSPRFEDWLLICFDGIQGILLNHPSHPDKKGLSKANNNNNNNNINNNNNNESKSNNNATTTTATPAVTATTTYQSVHCYKQLITIRRYKCVFVFYYCTVHCVSVFLLLATLLYSRAFFSTIIIIANKITGFIYPWLL